VDTFLSLSPESVKIFHKIRRERLTEVCIMAIVDRKDLPLYGLEGRRIKAMIGKTSNLVTIFATVAIGAVLVSSFQCSARHDIGAVLEKSQQNRASRMECAINPDTCKPAQ
jgi:hypothetical protein